MSITRSTRRPADDRALRERHALVVALTFVTGAADATGFLALGGAFSSVMTGNMVLLGLSTGTADAELARNAGSAIAAYVLGVLVGAWVAGTATDKDPVWPRQVTAALGLELAALTVFAVLWELTQGERSPGLRLTLLAIAAAALGIQGSAVQRFGVPGLSSTYLTGTLTTLIGGVAARRPRHELLPNARVLTALIVGAGAGAVVVDHAPRWSPALLVVPMAVISLLGWRLRTR
ncbi:YoaK family protein [Actinokineospora sp. NBRC 105648]|uniref:DUF1275 family protein n=1 Tax=Actinokineospora sp. NBRC 105648 TaxID=3032206 RepID=UPI0024A105C9|nr:YoaK family protein [Actinokineospora sp. NBRC 105648]GLZ40278.1 hypothetical protein Acsp05_39020 [Actinokineospora sp. NBRC 105648]